MKSSFLYILHVPGVSLLSMKSTNDSNYDNCSSIRVYCVWIARTRACEWIELHPHTYGLILATYICTRINISYNNIDKKNICLKPHLLYMNE